MDPDWGYKAVLTACVVAVVLTAAKLSGRCLAGIVAGLPIVSAPALLWVASSIGPHFGARAAVGSVAACAMLAAFAVGYEHNARRSGPALALGAGVLCAVTAAALIRASVSGVGTALLVALLGCAAALLVLPHISTVHAPSRRLRAEIPAVAAVAGGLSGAVALLAPLLGAFGAGVLASLPIIGGTVVVFEHATDGHRSVTRFLRGYVSGLVSKAVFGAVFALMLAEFDIRVSFLSALSACCLTAALIPWAVRRTATWKFHGRNVGTVSG